MSNLLKKKIIPFWEKNGQKILTFLAIFLISLASYHAGQTAERNRKTAAINITLTQPEKTANPKKETERTKLIENLLEEKLPEKNFSSNNPASLTEQDCLFVGSKNSNKYHLANCRYATKIKPENKRCFASQEEAKNAGYVAASCCVGKK